MDYRINCDIYTPYAIFIVSNLQFEVIIEFETAQLAEQLPNWSDKGSCMNVLTELQVNKRVVSFWTINQKND
jgi:hypothetical protein